MLISIDSILPNPEQPRREFDAGELEEMAESIRVHGVIQPIVVEVTGSGWMLVDGERRLRAARLAGLREIPAVVDMPRGADEAQERFMRALVANVQRADLTPLEEGRAYIRMRDEFGMSIAEITRAVGKSRGRVEQRMDLLKLDEPIQELITAGQLSKDTRVVTALLSIPDREVRVKTARGLAQRGASIKAAVQAAEKIRAMMAEPAPEKSGTPAVSFGVRRAGIDKPPLPAWDMLHQAGKIPPWEAVRDAAKRTCDGCGLREVASEDTCAQCPAVEMLAILFKIVEKR